MTIPSEYISLLVGGVFSVLWWLLKQKDAAQQKEMQKMQEDFVTALKEKEDKINLLFTKHDDDVKALHELRVQIADGHYKKTELDMKFDRLEFAFKSGFDVLGGKFDKLSDALINHISKEDKK